MFVKKLKDYKNELEKIDAELLNLPEGSLIKREKYYCHLINQKQVGITRNKKLQRKLCRTKYLLFRKKEVAKNISISENMPVKIHEATDKEVIDSFTGAYSEMPADYFYHPSVENFLSMSNKKNPYREEDLKYASNNGTRLRSKSEALIANQLESYDILYQYEIAVKLKNKTIYPDFTIINPYTGKTILWEHFGALHQEGYEKRMNEKMDEYLKLGHIPFETIIYTFEADVLNPARLKYLIENVILS